ncbi:helix-turn-helix domain-containing protein [Flavobacterium sp. LS1R49]|uniref:Helix-turn-helix domain-containing protein n=1 Tax=Flavobacterium shii TaxID=2987687 RepID=A0A9X3BZF7_9FLAO|nr:helix-turn-helix transcriptional regulator [Flavobacterium shii]MCV9929291.1 helix-turn-helix domain-containing protein [Flavobacterium shii]
MKLYQKVKAIREYKRLSQNYIAHELGLDQSQYSRREKGEIQFIPEEIIKLTHLLDTNVSNLFGEQEKSQPTEVRTTTNIVLISDKLIEQYEFRLKEKDELINTLHKKIKTIKA